MNPKISVIIPAYNAENTIKQCVQSVLDNTFTNFEIVVVDDGSKDNTAKIVKDLSSFDNRIRLIQKQNEGVSATRNRGIQEANAPYIMFLDSDDTYEPTCCEKANNTIEIEKTDIVMFGYYEKFNKQSKTMLCPITYTLNSQDEIYNELIEKHYMSGVNGYLGSVWLAVFKKTIIVENGIRFNEKLHHSEDKLFLLNYLFCCNRLAVVNEPLYNYELGDSSVTKKYSPTLEENHRVYGEEWKKLLTKYGHEDVVKNSSNGSVSLVFSIVLNEVREGNPKPFSQQIKKVKSTSKKYKSSVKSATANSRSLKIKKIIASHSSLCIAFFLIRRIQRAMGVYF